MSRKRRDARTRIGGVRKTGTEIETGSVTTTIASLGHLVAIEVHHTTTGDDAETRTTVIESVANEDVRRKDEDEIAVEVETGIDHERMRSIETATENAGIAMMIVLTARTDLIETGDKSRFRKQTESSIWTSLIEEV